VVAGAIVIALRGTDWGLYGPYGDASQLTSWAHSLLDNGSMPASYPPGFVHALAWYTQLTGGTPEHSLKVLQIVGTALFGPVVYLAWRLVLPPGWALGIGVVTALPLIDPYKPYTNVMLAVLIPVLLALLRLLRRSADRTWTRLVLAGAGFGVALGAIFLIYSGWFVWSAPGVLAAALLVFPWRRGWRQGLTLIAVTAVVFLAVAYRHLLGLLNLSNSTADRYFFFDTWAEPTYIAMWRGDLPGADPGPWPPPGELAGVGVFTLLLLLGLAAAIAVARRRTVVLALLCVFAGAWLLRFRFGSRMYADDAVQLYPRSTMELLYCLLLLSGFAIYYATRQFAGTAWLRTALSSASLRIGALAALMLLIASAGSATGDRYLPRTDNSAGMLAELSAQFTRQPNGSCAAYALEWGGCYSPGDPGYDELLARLRSNAPRPGDMPHR
jgi:galactan 5-O-arabinofuranosyltransferase